MHIVHYIQNSKENGSTGGGDCLETEAPPLPVITLSAPDEVYKTTSTYT